MSLQFRDKNGVTHILAGLTPGGDIEYGAVATREGTITVPDLGAGGSTIISVTFSETMPDNDYLVDLDLADPAQSGYGIPYTIGTRDRTVNGFNVSIINPTSGQHSSRKLKWIAYKLYTVADAEALYSTVQDMQKAFPADASSSNKLATIRDVTGETRSLDRRIDDLEDYMPSNVSISNKVATQADLANVSIDELGDIEDVDLNDLAEGQTLVWDSTNSKWVNGAGGKTYTAGDGITISNTDEISAKVDDTSITTDTNDALKVADTYKTIFVGTRAQWDALSTADKVKYNEAHITDDVIGGEVADEVTDGLMSPVTSNAVAGAISNPNLLDNPWFTINQRGITDNWDTQFSVGVDRWAKSSDSSSTLEVTTDGITEVDDKVFSIYQVLDSTATNYESIKRLYGKTLTLSVLFSDGTIETGSYNLPLSDYRPSTNQIRTFINNSTRIDYARIESFAAGNVNLAIRVKAGNVIRAVKLELGSVSTLAMDTAPNFQQELEKCRRYFVRYISNTNSTTPIGRGFVVNATTMWIDITLPTSMRAAPSLTCSDLSSFGYSERDSSSFVEFTNMAVGAMVVNHINITGVDNAHTMTIGNTYIVYAKNGAYIDFSADL